MKTKLSVCRRKQRYPSGGEALRAAAASGLVLRPYRCDRCWQFHLTSRTKGKPKPKLPSRLREGSGEGMA